MLKKLVKQWQRPPGPRLDGWRWAPHRRLASICLPKLIAGFLQENPRVEISVLGGNTQTILEALVEHRVQLCLIEGPAMRRDVRVEPFMEDHMVCVVPAGHEWADEEVDVKELQQATLVARELGSGSRRIVEQALEQAGVEVKKLRLRDDF